MDGVQMKNQWRLVAGILLILLIITFAVINVESVPVNFGFGKVTAPLIIIIFVSLLFGSLLTLLVSTTSSARNHKELRSMKQLVSQKDVQKEEAITHTKAEYEEKITILENNLVQKDNKIKSLENELVNQVTFDSQMNSTDSTVERNRNNTLL